ncbi:MAG: NAD(P)H-hydrate epimerase [Fuerstiella sp.]|nr:NAD(P)H-hydrate epimerase [Fuerstiella sp.]MCP4786611.1 NAD(P)H-hydrate epimerase [Fuerstiella sp.]MCP4854244.1 NAD(P)H-hydrate epimerase [Fuerstiella sp.]
MTEYPVLTCDQARRLDASAVSQLGLPSLLLMENAARGVTQELTKLRGNRGRVLVFCGPGNNGGDGLAIARLLASDGGDAVVYLLRAGKTLTDDAGRNLGFLRAAGGNIVEGDEVTNWDPVFDELTQNDWILDCLLGTGVRGCPRAPFANIIESINRASARVLAVDVPSGLDCDTGTANGACVKATTTVTFAGMKRGFLQPTSMKFTGSVTVAHIGIPLTWVRSWLSDVND